MAVDWELREAVTAASCCPAHERCGARFLKESAEKEVPGTMVRLGTPAIMGGKTALHSSYCCRSPTPVCAGWA